MHSDVHPTTKHSVSRQKHRATKISQVVDDARTWTQNTSLKCNGTTRTTSVRQHNGGTVQVAAWLWL